MLDAMVRLGRMLMNRGGDQNSIDMLVQPMPSVTGKDPCVMLVNIDTINGRLEFIPIECHTSDQDRLATELAWVGNAAGANSPQWTATTNSLRYLLSQTMINLQGMLREGSPLRSKLTGIREDWMVDLGPQQGHEERYRYVLDMERLTYVPAEHWRSIIEEGSTGPDQAIRAKDFVVNLEKEVLRLSALSANRVHLWSLCIDRERVVDDPDYRELVIRDKIQTVFEEASLGRCSSCGLPGDVTPNFTRMKFKYYNTDKISFASSVDKKRFGRNMSLCPTCYSALLAAEAFVHGKMRSRIGHLRFYVIPEILGHIPHDLDPQDWSTCVLNQVESTINFESVANLEDRMKLDQSAFEHLGYVVNLLFHVWNNAELRLYNLVRDVPNTRFNRLRTAFRHSEIAANVLLGPRSANEAIRWRFDFNALYHLIPVTRSNRSEEYRRVLQLFDALLTGQAISYRTLMESFCRLIEIRRFGRYAATNVPAPKAGFEITRLADDVLLANIVLFMLQDLGQLDGAPLMREESKVEENRSPESADAFLQQVGYRASQEALFWLGDAVANVATAQWNNNLDSMPVLEKINYRGLSAADVIRLVGKVEEAFQQYKLFTFGADSLFRMHVAFAQSLETTPLRWKPEYRLTDEEAVFYIMSGFAYRRKQILSRGRKESSDPKPAAEVQNA